MAAGAQGAVTSQPSLTDRKTVRTMRTRPRCISAGNIAASLTDEPARAVGTLLGVDMPPPINGPQRSNSTISATAFHPIDTQETCWSSLIEPSSLYSLAKSLGPADRQVDD
jgi:hypothetical protein